MALAEYNDATLAKKEETEKKDEKIEKRWRVPASTTNYDEKEDLFTIEIEMPGAGKDQLSIRVKDDKQLIVKAEINDELNYSTKYLFRKPIDVESVDAKIEYGLLTLKLKPQEPISKEIKVK